MLNIIDKDIYTEKGKLLKKIDCPKKVSLKDLRTDKEKTLYCKNCEKNILDTEYMSEEKLIEILQKDKDTCLKISRLNPMFRFVSCMI